MALKISGKNVDIGRALRLRIETRVSTAAAKFFDGSYAGHVTVTRSGRAFRTECAIHLDTGIVFEASADSGDAHLSFDQAAERLEKRLRRYKRRLKDHKGRSSAGRSSGTEAAAVAAVGPSANEEESREEDEGEAAAIVAETDAPILTLSVSAAVRKLESAEAPLVVFRNANHGGLNVVYRRMDGHVGWIDPALAELGVS